MSYEIIRGPFILMETVEMLYKYVNNISFLNIAAGCGCARWNGCRDATPHGTSAEIDSGGVRRAGPQ